MLFLVVSHLDVMQADAMGVSSALRLTPDNSRQVAEQMLPVLKALAQSDLLQQGLAWDEAQQALRSFDDGLKWTSAGLRAYKRGTAAAEQEQMDLIQTATGAGERVTLANIKEHAGEVYDAYDETIPTTGDPHLDIYIHAWFALAIFMVICFVLYLVIFILSLPLRLFGLTAGVGAMSFYHMPMLLYYACSSLLMGVITLGLANVWLKLDDVKEGGEGMTNFLFKLTSGIQIILTFIVQILERTESMMMELERDGMPAMRNLILTADKFMNSTSQVSEILDNVTLAVNDMMDAATALKATSARLDQRSKDLNERIDTLEDSTVPAVLPVYEPETPSITTDDAQIGYPSYEHEPSTPSTPTPQTPSTPSVPTPSTPQSPFNEAAQLQEDDENDVGALREAANKILDADDDDQYDLLPTVEDRFRQTYTPPVGAQPVLDDAGEAIAAARRVDLPAAAVRA